MDEDIVMNIDFEGISDPSGIQVVPSNIAWEDFELMLKVFSDQKAVVVNYTDEDNDEVTIKSQEELSEAFKVAKKFNNTLQVRVKCGDGSVEPIMVSDDEDDQVIADVKRQSVLMMQAKKSQEEEQTDATKADGASAVETNTVSMETGESQKQEEGAKSVEETKTSEEAEKNEEKPKQKHFFLKNEASQLVLDIQGGRSNSGTRIIVWDKKPVHLGTKNQLWYEHTETGTLRSVLNDFCLDATAEGAVINPYQPDKTSQLWTCADNKIQNRFNTSWVIVLPPKGDILGKYVCAGNYTGEPHQKWQMKYPREIKKRSANEETGEKTIPEFCQFLPAQVLKRQKKDKVRGYYAKLAEVVGMQQSAKPKARTASEKKDNDSGEKFPSTAESGDAVPAWFEAYMAKFKEEITAEIANLVTRKTVRQVLRGLEGAVITSVHATSGMPGGGPQQPQSQETQTRASSQGPTYCHTGVICDSCERTIAGVRYKCGNCEDYDLCEECEGIEGVHHPDHVFLKIRRPVLTAGRRKNGKMNSLLKRNLYEVEEEQNRKQEESKEVKREAKIRRKCEMIEQKLEEHMRRAEGDVSGKAEEKIEKMRRKEEKLKRRLEQIKDSPNKKERLDLPQFKTTLRMDASFIRDETVPDGTHVQPGTKLVKRWVMKNTGTHAWTSCTMLKMMWGNMPPVATEVSVPFLQPHDETVIGVELIAPQEPGTYQSHWRLVHRGARFGHRVWCHIIVDPKEVLETKETNIDLNVLSPTEDKEAAEKEKEIPSEPAVENTSITFTETSAATAAANLQSHSLEGATQVVDSDILTAQDILSFEMLDIRDRHTPKVSQTATPNNTPLDMTPPKSPIPEEDGPSTPLQAMSNSSSVEIVSEISPDGEADNAALMTQLVQERMASLGLKPDMPDIESWSSLSDDSNDSDSDDFYVVPIPDCFNPQLPASKAASTSIYVKRDDEPKSVDELLATSGTLSTQPLLPQKVDEPATGDNADTSDADSVPDGVYHDAEQLIIQPLELPCEEAEVQIVVPTTEAAVKVSVEEANEETPLLASQEEADDADETVKESVTTEDEEEEEEKDGDAEADGPNSDEDSDDDDEDDEEDDEEKARTSDVASNLVNAAIGVALQTGASVYSTAKDVFHALQAKNQYVPPTSQWEPKPQDWSPPNSEWTPPDNTWTPVESEVPDPKLNSPMEQLIEMGFCDRKLNKELMEKYDGQLEQVIQELISRGENDWHGNRH